jgi:hypothetical protein
MRRAICAVLGLLSITSSADGDVSLDVRLNRRLMNVPGFLTVTIVVERHEDNRLLTIATDSAAFYRSSQIPLDGAKAARRYSFTYSDLPAGQYVVEVTVHDRRGTVALNRQSFEVRRE